MKMQDNSMVNTVQILVHLVIATISTDELFHYFISFPSTQNTGLEYIPQLRLSQP